MSLSIELNVLPEEFNDWKKHPVTQKFMGQLKNFYGEAFETITQAQTIERPFAAQSTARVVGNIEILDAILNISLKEEEPA